MSTYYRPDTLEQALALMNEHTGAIKPYAGGTDLMVHLREQGGHLSGVDAFLDVTRLPELRMIQEAGDHIRIGAAVTHTEVADSPLIRQYAAALCEASASVGSTQIRNAGTIGGNVCNGSLAADTLSVLTALSAVVELQSVDGVREVEVSNLYLGRGKMDIRPNELVVAITIPILGLPVFFHQAGPTKSTGHFQNERGGGHEGGRRRGGRCANCARLRLFKAGAGLRGRDTFAGKGSLRGAV